MEEIWLRRAGSFRPEEGTFSESFDLLSEKACCRRRAKLLNCNVQNANQDKDERLFGQVRSIQRKVEAGKYRRGGGGGNCFSRQRFGGFSARGVIATSAKRFPWSVM